MKILQVINNFETGGAEKLLLETIPLYNNKGIEVDILLLNGEESPFLKELKKKNCCTIYSLGKGSVYNPILILKIIPYFKKYDLIHVHLFPAQYWVVLAKIISFSKIKIVVTEHNTKNKRLNSTLYRFIDKNIYKFYSIIICITKDVFSVIRNQTNLPFEKFQVIENGVDISSFKNAHPIEILKIASSMDVMDKLLIQVSRFSEQKDQKTLIKAMKILPNNIKLMLVGDGVIRKYCEELVEKLDIKERVFFLGNRTDVPQLIKTADICILSTHWEGFGIVAVESMASGKPFIGSNVTGLKEVIGNAGLLVPSGDENELAKTIIKLLGDKNFYDQVSKACQERAEQYDINKMVEKHIVLYKNLHSYVRN